VTTSFVLRRIGFYVLICAITLFFAVPMLWIASAPFDASPGLGVHWPDWMMSATASIDDVLTRRP